MLERLLIWFSVAFSAIVLILSAYALVASIKNPNKPTAEYLTRAP
jgi:hypothetical protein